jgi:hypothetical protein
MKMGGWTCLGNPNGVAIIQPRVGAGDTSPRAYPEKASHKNNPVRVESTTTDDWQIRFNSFRVGILSKPTQGSSFLATLG